eukprot:scaffold40607_cov38-Cyclotella_meneghiniana.AAC.1
MCSAFPPSLPIPLKLHFIAVYYNAGGELGRVAGPKADGRTRQTLCCCHNNLWVAATAAATKAARIPLFVAAYQRGGGGGRS